MDLHTLIASLQFPAPGEAGADYAVSLLQNTVNIVPSLQYARDIAAVSRMMVLSPAIWSEPFLLISSRSRPTGLIVADAFRAIVHARLKRPLHGIARQVNEDDAQRFVLALLGGISSCQDVASRQLCATSGILASTPLAAIPQIESAFVETLNIIADGARCDDDVSLTVCSTMGYEHISSGHRSRIRATPLLTTIFARAVFAMPRHPDMSAIAGASSQFTGKMYKSLAMSYGPKQCHEPLSIITAANSRARGRADVKESAFATVAVLSGLVDGLQLRHRPLGSFLFLRESAAEVAIAKSIIFTLRDLSTTIYEISLAGFAAESYLHSAAVGILMTGTGGDNVDALVDGLQDTGQQHEYLFALNTAEKILLSSPASSQFRFPLASKIIRPAQLVISRPMAEYGTTIGKAIHEAAHAVILASLLVPTLAVENGQYVKDIYLPRLIDLYDKSEITDTQFAAAIRALSNALSSGSGVLSSAAPALAEEVLLPSLTGFLRGNKKTTVTGALVDAILRCAPVERINFWLGTLDGDADLIAERIRKGDVPSVCGEGVVRWWFDSNQAESRGSSRL
ncbi:hypothetical protein V1525DRAFT_410728 [Lipomyces kononenkoae]|uniref:Uncharacterized protein n=1 Tax=Lipomyces kononenkoae TaxID=34357 RepID=A0ACC3SV37_LIPKO